ncbi:MAG: hypothetical protein EZS28_040874 [Streblomastix strix]|uniref:Uncharacterized protein n=1 Tax=Streblomastix strix TaxID=222440 RepID=A0A5J4U029_9EUKA|nr:MAG: hypothetical protein EZS28_040874 [Streblomastix strix]
MNLVGQSVQFQLRRHEFLAPAIELTDQNIDTLKQLIGLDHQQDNQAIQRQVQIQPNLRYAPPQIIFQQTPYENREQEVSNYGNPYQSQNSSQSFEQGQDQHHIHPDQNQIYNEVENKEIEDKKKEIVKKQKKMNKETKIDQKHPESKNLKHKSKSHQTKKEKEKEYEKMNDNYNSENEQEKQSTDKVDDPKDADHEQLTHKGLENNSIEDAEDV